MKAIIFALLIAAGFGPVLAQDNSFNMEPEPPSIIARISIISPKLIAEIAPSENFTLSTGFWIRTSFWEYKESGQSFSQPYFSPSFTFEPRYYFNLEDRQKKGKPTRYYSGWYLGLPLNIEFPDFRYSLGGSIGFQGTMGRRWYWNISTGPGFTYADSRYYWSGSGDFGLGIILNKM